MANDKIDIYTNAAFIIAGLALPVELGAYLIALGILSALHHAIGNEFTLALDYAGMYVVGYALVLYGLGLPVWTAILGAVLTVAWLQDSRVVIGVIIGVVLGVLAFKAGPGPMLHVAAWLGAAYVFNYIGDNIHRESHGLIHGIWHVLSAYALLLTFGYL